MNTKQFVTHEPSRNRAAIIGVVCALLVATPSRPALANWQYTTWGMSPDQVAAASNGVVSVGATRAGDRMEGLDAGAAGQYISGKYSFRVVFYFSNNALAVVLLTLTGANFNSCMDLKNDLKGVYGKPFDGSSSAIVDTSTWQDRNAGNFVAILTIGTDATASCSVQYKPLSSSSAKGL